MSGHPLQIGKVMPRHARPPQRDDADYDDEQVPLSLCCHRQVGSPGYSEKKEGTILFSICICDTGHGWEKRRNSRGFSLHYGRGLRNAVAKAGKEEAILYTADPATGVSTMVW